MIFIFRSNNPQQSERYYSFTWGNGKFICLDANIDYSIGSDQHNWMLEELQCNDRQWLFMFFHQPPWTNAWSADYYIPFTTYYLYQGNEDMRTDLVPYFEQYNVDFVLNGHSHCYQRGELNGVKYIYLEARVHLHLILTQTAILQILTLKFTPINMYASTLQAIQRHM